MQEKKQKIKLKCLKLLLSQIGFSLSLKPVGLSLSLKDWCFTLSFAQINVCLLVVSLSMDLSLFASSLHGGGGSWLWKCWLVGSSGESWGGFVDCLVLVSMSFGVLDLRCFGVLVFARFCSQWVLVFGC